MSVTRHFTIFLILLPVFLIRPAISHCEDRDLAQVVRHMEMEYHLKQTKIPLWGVINGFARVARPWKDLGMSLAIFEDQNLQIADFNSFESRIQSALGEGWQPFVRVQSKKDGERTVIFVKPHDKKFKMMIICLESSETTVVKMQVSWKEFGHWVENKVDKDDQPG
jgi:hypothetical protein